MKDRGHRVITMAVVLVVALVALSWASTAQSSSVPLVDAAKSFVVPNGDGSYGSVADTFYATSILKMSGSRPPVEVSKTCAWVSAQPAAATVADASRLLFLATLVCKDAPDVAKAAEEALLKAAESPTSVEEVYHIANALTAASGSGFSNVKKSALAASLSLLKNLQQPLGLWKNSASDDSVSPLASGYALSALACLVELGAVSAAEAEGIVGDARVFFSATRVGDDAASYVEAGPEEGGPLAATAVTTSGYLALSLAAGGALKVKPQTVAELAAYIVGSGAPLSLVEAFYSVQAAWFLSNNRVAVPLILSLPGQQSLSAQQPVAVSLHTAVGTPAAGASVTLRSVRVVGGKRNVLSSPVDLATSASGSFGLPLSAFADSSPGAYALTFEVTSSDATHVSLPSLTRKLVLTTPVTLSAATVAVLDSDGASPEAKAEVDLSTVPPKNPATLSASHLQKLSVSVSASVPSGAPFTPHQALVSLRHVESGTQHILVLHKTRNQLQLKLDLLESMEKFFYLSGEYQITLTLGDTVMENSGSWVLGTVDVDFPAAPDSAPKPPAAPKPLADRFGPQKEIAHIFRKPDKRPAPAVSYAFSAIALLPLVFLLIGLQALGVNLKLLPSGGVPFLAAVGFHAGIAAILVLYAAFWVQVKLFTTLKLLLVLALVTAVPGHRILSYLADTSSKVKTA